MAACRFAPGGGTVPTVVVDVWRVDLDGDHDASVLERAELDRGARKRDERTRARFLASRAWLRVILAGYLDIEPAQVRYEVAGRGKPFVAGGGDVCFSVSRSADVALVAVSRRGDVGVDVERIRGDVDHIGLADRFFTAAEAEMLRSVPGPDRVAAFFELWVRKEAVVKASGDGLAGGLGHVDVRDGIAGGRWSLAAVDAGPGFRAAVATSGAPLAHRVLDVTASLAGAGRRSTPPAARRGSR